MTTKKSKTVRFLESLIGESLTIGNLIEAIRIGEGISQVEFAAKLGISRSHLCDIEKGRKHVSVAKASEYAALLGYSEQQFIELALQDQVNKLDVPYRVYLDVSRNRAA